MSTYHQNTKYLNSISPYTYTPTISGGTNKESEKSESEETMDFMTTITNIDAKLKKIQAAFEDIKKLGIHRDILIVYLHDKSGISKRDIESILFAQEDFYNKLSIPYDKEIALSKQIDANKETKVKK